MADGCYQCHGTVGQGSRGTGPRLAPNPLPYENFADAAAQARQRHAALYRAGGERRAARRHLCLREQPAGSGETRGRQDPALAGRDRRRGRWWPGPSPGREGAANGSLLRGRSGVRPYQQFVHAAVLSQRRRPANRCIPSGGRGLFEIGHRKSSSLAVRGAHRLCNFEQSASGYFDTQKLVAFAIWLGRFRHLLRLRSRGELHDQSNSCCEEQANAQEQAQTFIRFPEVPGNRRRRAHHLPLWKRPRNLRAGRCRGCGLLCAEGKGEAHRRLQARQGGHRRDPGGGRILRRSPA